MALYNDIDESLVKDVERIERLNRTKSLKRTTIDREKCILEFNSKRDKFLNMDMQHRYRYTNGREHSCMKDLSELTPIKLNELKLPKIHLGKYLLCRTITSAYTIIGMNVLIEDITGEVEELQLFNFQRKLTDNPDKILPLNTIMIIKEPYFCYSSSDKSVCIRCESLSDIIFLEEDDDLLKGLSWFKLFTLTFEQLKDNGNELFKQNDYLNALKYYNRAIKMNKDHPVILLNRSATYLKLGHYGDAYNDAKRAFELSNETNEKALFRMGKAAYGMRQWNIAIENYTKLLELYPNNVEGEKELKRSKKRLDESLTGNYDLIDIYDKSQNFEYNIDVADYIGPIKVNNIDGKGKAIIAIKNIKKGTLLAVSKAFAYVNEFELSGSLRLTSVNLINKTVDTQSQVQNLIETVHKLKANPYMAKDLYRLYAGDLDRENINDIPEGVIDIGRIEKIVTYNQFRPAHSILPIPDIPMCTGLWLLPSFINHSCLANADCCYYGDVVFICALYDIKKDEEITIPYIISHKPFFKRIETLNVIYGFYCYCQLCHLDYEEGLSLDMEQAYTEKLNCLELIETSDPFYRINEAVSIVKFIKNTYNKNRNDYKVKLILPMQKLAHIFRINGYLVKAIKFYLESIDAAGSLWHLTTPYPLLFIAGCYMQSNNINKATEYTQKAFEENRIRTYMNKEQFKHIFSSTLKENRIYDLI